MRFDEIYPLYPQILEWLQTTADQLRGGTRPEQVMAWMELRVGKEIKKQHRLGVMEKIWEWAQAIIENDGLDFENGQRESENDTRDSGNGRRLPKMAQPVYCPDCGGIKDYENSRCWCRNQPAA